MIYYLYVKTHNQTDLKYLGYTMRNPYEYKGSGKYWKRHLKQYSNNVSTEIVGAFDNLDDLKVAGLFWSKKWNVVKSKSWANLTEERGEGGTGMKDKTVTKETKKRISKSLQGHIGWNKGQESRDKMRQAKVGEKNHMFGKKHTIESMIKMRRPKNKTLIKQNLTFLSQ